MSPSWSRKDERMYERVRDTQLDRGIPEERAEEIAGRTVNKQRRMEGRTPKRTSAGTGNPRRSLDERSRDELYNRARELGIQGRSMMTRAELIAAIRER
jgi:hypothetical protein